MWNRLAVTIDARVDEGNSAEGYKKARSDQEVCNLQYNTGVDLITTGVVRQSGKDWLLLQLLKECPDEGR